ncbi:MAG TPA: serine--tRNA ligase [Magnetospirillaceae bacterium]|nr:serine--tRNA ligase [Magnetospirillaceae bacterium]
MLDIRYIREHAAEVEKKAKQKGYDVDISALLKLDDSRREQQTKADELRQKRNAVAGEVKKGKPSIEQIEEGKRLKTELAELEDHLRIVNNEFVAALKKVPNMPLNYVPVGDSEDKNVVEKTVGKPRTFDFEPKNHAELEEQRGWLDKERAAKVAGSRFAYIKGDLVRLQFALTQWVMDVLTSEKTLQKIIDDAGLKVSAKPFVPIVPPAVVKTEPYEATARLNREEVTYKIEQDDLWLNASAEHSLAPMYWNEILPESDLPIRYLGYSTSFRREAGTYGKDMEGTFRLHQFDKLEMESFSTPETGLQEHTFMVAIQEHLMQQLGIPYQLLQKCTFDIGGPNAAGVDINAWLPGQNKYRETHTADYMTDYQARRLSTRVRRADGRVELLHTNDATAFAMSRAPIAIIENYQNQDGTVTVPEVLRPYLGGREIL